MEHRKSWGCAFADGLKVHGWRVKVQTKPEPADLLVMWGVRDKRAISAQTISGGEVCILERGYVGDRFAYSSVSFGGGLNGRAIFRGPFHDGSRFDRNFGHLLQPWRRSKGYALVIGQVPGDQSLAGTNIGKWCTETARRLLGCGWDVRFRPHPVALERGYCTNVPGIPTQSGDLGTVLASSQIVVTFNSNTAVEAVLAGVPTVAVDKGSMAWNVTGHDVGAEPPMPDRTAWARALAWKQFKRGEMESGLCQEAVGLGATS